MSTWSSSSRAVCLVLPFTCVVNIPPLSSLQKTLHGFVCIRSKLKLPVCPVGRSSNPYLRAQLGQVAGPDTCIPHVFSKTPFKQILMAITLHAVIPVHANAARRCVFESHSQFCFVDEMLSRVWSLDICTTQRVSTAWIVEVGIWRAAG